ncbi:polyprenyl synthetase family protein [Streptacidiphilus jiangxiensis]|uniref:Heptaprenyl diphosphate synthase n=1 Tax=Streptacidiphilus jiangxiensis TaxID=235985 RepID=A0A1H7IBG6_STRJI|nr:polyprenyl synthetase family protein [Streptacidiphilus jiangxiensis]SEK59087.1 heptaprenyl diphosphate synthase [Streptacidiphilus jiangxiensis]
MTPTTVAPQRAAATVRGRSEASPWLGERITERVARVVTAPPHRAVAALVGPSRLTADLADCVEAVCRIAGEDPAIVPDGLLPLLLGGKRLRPLLVLAVGYACRPLGTPHRRARTVQSAAVVELLHLASLVHDDVMDGSRLRHGVATVNAEAGVGRAVLTGDFLIAQALAAAGSLGAAEGVLAARTFARLCQGQAEEGAALFDPSRSEESYLRAVDGKTASLFEASCELGAMAAGLTTTQCAALARYGRHLGIAFQLNDDILDFTADSAQLGKPVGHDIGQGVYTLPLLRTLRARPELASLLARPEEMAARVRAGDALAGTARLASAHAGLAVAALAEVGEPLHPAGHGTLAELAAALTRPILPPAEETRPW